MKHRILVESPGEGQGSTFKVQLPLKTRGAGPSGGEETERKGVV